MDKVSKAARIMEINAPLIRAEAESRARRASPVMEPRPTPRMGDMRGATTIAPMMTAGESLISPRVAIAPERTTKKK